MIRAFFIAVVGVLLAPPALLAQPPDAKPIAMTLRPAAVPSPALKYRLIPPVEDLTSRNAVFHYYRAFSPEWINTWRNNELTMKVEKWERLPLKDLPPEADKLLEMPALEELERGARADHADWDLRDTLRKEGIQTRLPDVEVFRSFAKLLAVRARVHMAHGHFAQALVNLQTGLAMARHLNDGPTPIHVLVGAAVGEIMLEQVETLIQLPQGPNLFWALAELPQPFVTFRKSLLGETLIIHNLFPARKEIESGPMKIDQIRDQVDFALSILNGFGGTSTPPSRWEQRVMVTALTAKFYGPAKRHLLLAGYQPDQIEAMPALQVVVLYSLSQYYESRDNVFKLVALPFWQAYPGFMREERKLITARNEMTEGIPLASRLIPSLRSVYFVQARLERRLAALRCLEALRLYAAAHQGQLPDRLTELANWPLAINPVTGKDFEYSRAGDKANLRGPGIPGSAQEALWYEVTMAK